MYKFLFVFLIFGYSYSGVGDYLHSYKIYNNDLDDSLRSLGYKMLFDGTSASILEHWEDNSAWFLGCTDNSAAAAADGVYCMQEEGGGRGATRSAQFSNIEFYMEYLLPGPSNSGIFYRHIPGTSDVARSVEYQIIHGDGEKGKGGLAAAYDIIPPAKNNYTGANEWQVVRIVMVDDTIEHWHNGEIMVKYIYWSSRFTRAIQSSKFAGSAGFASRFTNENLYPNIGNIVFQTGYSGNMFMRNVRYREVNKLEGCLTPGEFFDSLAANHNSNFCNATTSAFHNSIISSNLLAQNYSNKGLSFSVQLNSHYTLELYNISGKLVSSQQGSGFSNHLFDNISKGLYFTRLKSSQKEFSNSFLYY